MVHVCCLTHPLIHTIFVRLIRMFRSFSIDRESPRAQDPELMPTFPSLNEGDRFDLFSFIHMFVYFGGSLNDHDME
jgi:hypothetical protein